MALFERLPVLLYGQWLFPNAVIYGLIPKAAAQTALPSEWSCPIWPVQVLPLTEDRRPLKVRFTFTKTLEHKSLCFYRWKETGFLPFDLPEVGDSVQLSKADLPL